MKLIFSTIAGVASSYLQAFTVLMDTTEITWLRSAAKYHQSAEDATKKKKDLPIFLLNAKDTRNRGELYTENHT